MDSASKKRDTVRLHTVRSAKRSPAPSRSPNADSAPPHQPLGRFRIRRGRLARRCRLVTSAFGTPAAQRRTKTGYSCANRLRHSARPGGGRRGGGRRRPPARPGRRRRAPPPPAPTRATTPPPAPPCASPTSAAPPPERKDMKSAKCVILGGTAARRTGWPARKSRWLRPLPAGMPPASAPNATVLGPPPTLCGASAFLTSCAPHAATPGP